MADIRIKDLTTTASSSASDDFIAIDGTTNGTRKLSAFSPTFGGNATVTGTLSSGGDLSVTGTSAQLILGQSSGSALTYYVKPAQAGGAIQIVQDSGTVNRWISLGAVNNSSVYTESLRITNGGHVAVTNTTASTTTSSGALVVSGGVGVGGAINAGGAIGSDSNIIAARAAIGRGDVGSPGAIGLVSLLDVSGGIGRLQAYNFTTSTVGALNIQSLGGALGIGSTSTVTTINGTTASTSISSGALVVSGGVGVAGAVNAGTFYGLVDGVTAPGTESGYARIYVDSADGDLKVKFGDGTVKTIATDS